MKPILMIVAACAVLLFAQSAEAKLFHSKATEVQVAASVAPVVREAVVAKPQAVRYRQGSRRLKLRERLKARFEAMRAIRKVRVQTYEPVVMPVSSNTHGVECSGLKR